ncbi:PH domain-containing protein [Halosimplex pelagicum]|uniref:PH domain-containing protein n=1 Tax=Halosimplex pelagicum TaxID=869886 RepID=A0A7D5TIA8_9EURY|nr:PH domain-containing protein [Halosimplex pelagicum]
MTDPRDDGDGADPHAEGVATDAESAGDPSVGTDRSPSDDSRAAEDPAADTDDRPVAESVETPGEPRTLDPTVRVEWIVGPLVGALLTAAVAGFITWAVAAEYLPYDRLPSAVAVGAGLFVLFAVYGAVRAVFLYRSWRYVVRDESLYLTRGVLTEVQTVVPYVRVQHIDTRRSAFERVLGLSTLVVYTAGSRGADVTIPGLTPDTADDLQSRLERLAIASEDEDAV